MGNVFGFFLRLFVCFVAAKFILHAVELEGRGYLVAMTVIFLLNVYLFQFFVFRDRAASPAASKEDPQS